MTRHFTPHHLIGRGGGHCLRSIHFALVLPLRSSHMPLMPRTVGWLTRPNPTNVYQRTSSCRHWETSHWGRRRLPKANLFCFVVGVSRGFCVGFRDGSSGERISTRRMEWSFLAKVLRGRPLRFRSHKIHQSSVWQSHCAQVLKHLTFQNIFFSVLPSPCKITIYIPPTVGRVQIQKISHRTALCDLAHWNLKANWQLATIFSLILS